MATTLAALLPDILGRIEEALPTDTPPGPVFWSLAGEVYPEMVYGLFEAALVTGVVQLSSYQITLQPNTTYFALQKTTSGLWAYGNGNGGYGVSQVIPKGIIAPLRMRAPYGLRKTTLKGLDDMYPQWSQADPGPQIQSWFPLGTSGFGIYPQLNLAQNVTMDFLECPVNEYRPYNGSETIPLQAEFTDLLPKYAAAMLRAKEGGAEAEEASTVFEEYMAELKDLSLFQSRIDSIVFSAAYGAKSQVNPRSAV